MFHVKPTPLNPSDATPEGVSSARDSDNVTALRAALLDIDLPAAALSQLAHHWQLVVAWNARTNLTAVSTAADAAWLHYRDSLAALPYLQAEPIVDFGSGAGFPGLVLAVARPNWAFTLVEPRRKRVSFLHTAVARLGLRNVRVLECRMQDHPNAAYAHAVTRATFSDPMQLHHAAAWLQPNGSCLVFRGPNTAPSAAATSHTYALQGVARRLDIWTRVGLQMLI